jgi:alpha-mannosidase
MNGIDHAEPEPRLPEIIAAAKLSFPDLQLSPGTLEGHLQQVRQAGKELPEYQGEFRWGRYSEVLQGVYSTRIGLKQENQRVEGLLERYAEPLTALAWALTKDVPEGVPDLLQTAWRWLLKNHPHDDIYGSGIDLTHAEMAYRFNQAEQIGQVLVRDSLRQIAQQLNFNAQPGMPVLVFNPLGWERAEMVVAEIDFEADDPTADHFQVVDSSGATLSCQLLADEQLFWMETLKANRKRRVKVAFTAQVPGCGYRAYYIIPVAPAPLNGQGLDNASPNNPLLVFENGAENEFLRFSINTDGTLDVLDKTSGSSYAGLGAFVDVDDAGDEYSYSQCVQSQTLTTRGGLAQISHLRAGPNLATFRVELVFRLPDGLSSDRQRRSEKLVDVPLISDITLYRGQPGITIQTTLENRACDQVIVASHDQTRLCLGGWSLRSAGAPHRITAKPGLGDIHLMRNACSLT